MSEGGGSYAVFDRIEMRPGGREELLDGIGEDFPYLGVRSEHDRYADRAVPWHWHQEIELFYACSGSVDYATPHDRAVVREGSAGLVNANVLHATNATGGRRGANLLIHEFRPALLAEPSSRVYRRYVEPLTGATSVELLVATPEDEATRGLCEAVRRSFETFELGGDGWELRLRNELSEIWLGFLELARPRLSGGPAAMPSARECHRTFRESLGVTPQQYLRDYRVQQACRMLAHITRPMGAVAELSGLGSAAPHGRASAGRSCAPRSTPPSRSPPPRSRDAQGGVGRRSPLTPSGRTRGEKGAGTHSFSRPGAVRSNASSAYARPTEPRLFMRTLTSSVISAMPGLAGFLGSKAPGFSAM